MNDQHVKAAIHHAEPIIRKAAVDYFASPRSNDPTIMPLIMQACDHYGIDLCLNMFPDGAALVQTSITVDWMIEQAHAAEASGRKAVVAAMGESLKTCDVGMLAVRVQALGRLSLPAQVVWTMNTRLTLAGCTWQDLWHAFVQIHHDDEATRSSDDYQGYPREYVELLLEALSRHPEARAQALLLLHSQLNGGPSELQSRAFSWVGKLGLEAAVPVLVGVLEAEAAENRVVPLAYEAAVAMEQMRTISVVQAIPKLWPRMHRDRRWWLALSLKHIHCDLSLDLALTFLKSESDVDVACNLGHAALAHFDARAIMPVREFIRGGELNCRRDLQSFEVWRDLIVASTITGARFNGYEEEYDSLIRGGPYPTFDAMPTS